MNYLNVCQWQVVDSEIFDLDVHARAAEQTLTQIWAYYDQAVELGTRGDEAERSLEPARARRLYRDAYLCTKEAAVLSDACYGLFPVTRIPDIEDLLATAVYYAELSGLLRERDHIESIIRTRRDI